ncbi:MAG: serine/threonine protein kinase [Bradymonadaceae bacterium]|nr:serine/threonine protein kinase [Lujinxingiaceae bacterium]
MAEVFRAKPFNAPDGRHYLALKRILPHLAEDEQFIKMFIDEAKLTVQLRHPNIVQIYELGQFQSSYYILMEYIAGHDLLALQKLHRKERTVMSVAQACFIAREVARGMDYAHRRHDVDGNPLNIIHRDISPQNVLVGFDGQVKVIDFGIAKAAVQSTHTQVGVLKGKFGYMSPEQVRGLVIDQRSDVFAIGTLFWELLTNRRLFRGEHEIETLQMVRDPKVDPPSTVNPQIPAEVDRIVMKSLAGERDDRFTWASELADELDNFLNSIDPPFGPANLGSWMEQAFEEDFVAEQQKHLEFQEIRSAEDVIRISTPPSSNESEEAVEGATMIWDAELAPEIGEDAEAFAANHTVVQAGGFDLSQFMAEQEALAAAQSERQRNLASQPVISAANAFGASANAVRVGNVGLAEMGTQPGVQNPLASQLAAPAARAWILIAFFAVLVFVGLSVTVLYMLFGSRDIATTVAASNEGTVVVNVTPPTNLQILVAGVRRGDTSPVTVSGLVAGLHLVEIRHPNFETFQRSVEVPAGGVVPIEAALQPRTVAMGELHLSWPKLDGIEVFIDTEPAQIGADGKLVLPVPVGQRLIEALAPGRRPYSRFVEVTAGEVTESAIELASPKLSLTISTEPSTSVFVNGKSLGRSPVKVSGLDPTQIHTLKLGRWQTALGFPDLGKGTLHYVLAELPLPKKATDYGWITASTTQGWFHVEINGIAIGRITPITSADRLPVAEGNHTVTFRRGNQSRDFKADVEAGLTVLVK